MRIFLDITYDGSTYHGWQKQDNAITIQEVIESSLHKILAKECPIVASGRTDAGVHATQQIAHLDCPDGMDTTQLMYQLNSILPKEIAINDCLEVRADAHARFDATLRTYRYLIHSRKDPFKFGRSYYFKAPLDLPAIRSACEILIEWTDFQSFSKVKTEVNNFECSIFSAVWEPLSLGYVFTISANRFLRGMVRALVGTLLEIGQNKLSLEDFNSILRQKDRKSAGRSVPAEGLYLSRVEYPKSIYIEQIGQG